SADCGELFPSKTRSELIEVPNYHAAANLLVDKKEPRMKLPLGTRRLNGQAILQMCRQVTANAGYYSFCLFRQFTLSLDCKQHIRIRGRVLSACSAAHSHGTS